MSILIVLPFAAVAPEVHAQNGREASRVERLEAQVRELQQSVATYRGEVGELRRRLGEQHLEQVRDEQVRQMVREVLADADGRDAFGTGLRAGHDGKFFLASGDDAFRLNLAGHLQVRYTFNQRDDAGAGEDDNLGGFNLRRAKFKANGWVTAGQRKIKYALSLAGDQDRGDSPIFEDFYLEVPDFPVTDLALRAGRFKQPFALQNLTSSSRQLAVERAAVHEVFRVDRSEGVMLHYGGDHFRLSGAVNDGIQAHKTDFDQDSADIAFTGRGELLLAGQWGQLKDPATAWSNEPMGFFVGGGLHYEVGETGEDTVNRDFLLWTADATFEHQGFGVMAAGYGFHTDMDAGADFDDFGLLVESGYFVIPDRLQPFVRYEMILADDGRAPVVAGDMSEQTDILTAGVNWYHAKHSAKFTLDVVYAFDPLFETTAGPGADPESMVSSSLGLRPDASGEDDQVAARAQYQLTW